MIMRFTDHPTSTNDHAHAKRLRRESSAYEEKLWFALRQAAKSKRLRFRFQQPIHPDIVDFICMKAKLIIELDGMSHDSRQAYDEERASYLSRQGYTVIRFANDDVKNNAAGVAETIVDAAERLLLKTEQGIG